MNFLNTVFSLLQFVPQIIILIAAIIILQQTKSVGAKLMLVGQGINMLPSIMSLIYPMLFQTFNVGSHVVRITYRATSIVHILALSLFGIGLLLIANELKKDVSF
jgi:hypothetical protein